MLKEKNLPKWLKNVITKTQQHPDYLADIYHKIEQLQTLHITSSQYTFQTAHSHPRLNRYSDILPYDHNRITLLTPSPSNISDYINASFVRGLEGTQPYIVTQGPLENTKGDFWQMIWEGGSRVVVMLTKEEEKGRMKCGRYWPEVGSVLRCENLGIRVEGKGEEEIEGGEILIRTFEMFCGGEMRRVEQIHYLAWPDHRASTPSSFLKVLDLSRSVQRKLSEEAGKDVGPMVVHCSAGCGRTGTFGVIDGVLTLLEKGKKGTLSSEVESEGDLIKLTVERFREQRVSMVQTLEQFVFCYEAVLFRLLEWQRMEEEEES